MQETNSISIVGNGNVAFHLTKAFLEKDFQVDGIYIRDRSKGEKFLLELGVEIPLKGIGDPCYSNFLLIAVNDNAIDEVIRQLNPSDKTILIHTSGAVDIEIFSKKRINEYGCLYPLQTFRKEKEINYSDLRFFIEGSNQLVKGKIEILASVLSKKVYPLSSKERLRLHIAAVFASNFTNHMLMLSEKIMHGAELDMKILEPLVRETIDKAFEIGPSKAQTGPAQRKDLETIEKHLTSLENFDRELFETYQTLTNYLLDRSDEN